MKTHRLFLNESAAVASATLYPQRRWTKRGLFWVQWNRSGTFDLELQGRPDSTASWATLISIDERDPGRLTGRYVEPSWHLPQMRAILTTSTGGSKNTVWYRE